MTTSSDWIPCHPYAHRPLRGIVLSLGIVLGVAVTSVFAAWVLAKVGMLFAMGA